VNKLLPANVEETPAVVAKADSSPFLVRADNGGLHRCDGNGPLPHTCGRVSECHRGWTLTELLAVILFARPVAG
jgi:hypothetical protein